ncbi:hypothetical protein BABINDRAFT_163216 [Babjeviella inositovora NRRL Y-12698]|uniref:Uncharacterized protein n=1 Tax=Babjeviella inositovora NRRL Y-12698 TaxID=984486 RepID=A0A1E3QJH1_9ASCO|nr:uncharacterized protein BABINDRAFT_163216 [Babjeviella inositovora NRRL Y-12698]ODQ77829.1 hypothetical protein BABINDRAFT_163216 [Babjeviella inositovora NRRL Y-12698]
MFKIQNCLRHQRRGLLTRRSQSVTASGLTPVHNALSRIQSLSPGSEITFTQLQSLTEELLSMQQSDTIRLAALEPLIRPHRAQFLEFIHAKYKTMFAAKRLGAILAEQRVEEAHPETKILRNIHQLEPFILSQPSIVLDFLREEFPEKGTEMVRFIHKARSLNALDVAYLLPLILPHYYELARLLRDACGSGPVSPSMAHNLALMAVLHNNLSQQAFALIHDALAEKIPLDQSLLESFFASLVGSSLDAAFTLLQLLHSHNLHHLTSHNLNLFLAEAASQSQFEKVLWVWNKCVKKGWLQVENGSLMAIAKAANRLGKTTFVKEVYQHYIVHQPHPPSFIAQASSVSENLLELYAFKKEVMIYRVEDAARWENHRSVFKIFNESYHELPRDVKDSLRVADFPHFINLLAKRYKEDYYQKTYGSSLEEVMMGRWRMARIMFNLNIVALIKAGQVHYAVDLVKKFRGLAWIRIDNETFFYLLKACQLQEKDDLFLIVLQLRRQSFRRVKLNYNTYVVLFHYFLRNRDLALCELYLREFVLSGFTVDLYLETVLGSERELLMKYK